MNDLIRSRLREWFQRNGRDLPWRRHPSPYAVMVSEFMLQQTQVVTVIPYFERWMMRFPDFATLAAAAEEEVMHAWQGLGYYSRARNLHKAAKHVMAEHGGQLPADLEVISRLPGVGRYTAGAIASFAFDLPVAAVDANIARVLARVFDMRHPVDGTQGQRAIWDLAERLLPGSNGSGKATTGVKGGRAHTSALMELGALVCLPRTPKCLLCPIKEQCQTKDPATLPIKKPRRQVVRIQEDCAWVLSKDRLLLQEQKGPRWRGLWKLPLLEDAADAEPLLELEYPFTHHVVTLRVFSKGVPGRLPEHSRWWPVAELGNAALAAGHRRALERLAALVG